MITSNYKTYTVMALAFCFGAFNIALAMQANSSTESNQLQTRSKSVKSATCETPNRPSSFQNTDFNALTPMHEFPNNPFIDAELHLLADIGNDGRLTTVAVVKAEPRKNRYYYLAYRQVRNWRFVPSITNCQLDPYPIQLLIKFKYIAPATPTGDDIISIAHDKIYWRFGNRPRIPQPY